MLSISINPIKWTSGIFKTFKRQVLTETKQTFDDPAIIMLTNGLKQKLKQKNITFNCNKIKADNLPCINISSDVLSSKWRGIGSTSKTIYSEVTILFFDNHEKRIMSITKEAYDLFSGHEMLEKDIMNITDLSLKNEITIHTEKKFFFIKRKWFVRKIEFTMNYFSD